MALVVGQKATSQEIKARWVYSELASPRAGRRYRQFTLNGLDIKAARGVDFDLLQPQELLLLSQLLEPARGQMMAQVDRHEGFVLEEWSKGRLCMCYALSHFNTPARARQMHYFDFLEWPREANPDGISDDADPRVHATTIGRNSQRTFSEALIAVAGYPNILVDGYLRSILFMRDAPITTRLPVWVGLGSGE